MRKGVRAQTTIFIIIAIVIVAVIALVVALINRGTLDAFFQKPAMPIPSEFIEKCAKDATAEAINLSIYQGGYTNPTNYRLYNHKKFAYLCYNYNYYLPCINQEPAYFSHLEKEIEGYITPKLNECFSKMKKNYEDAGYSTNMDDDSNMKVEVTLKPQKVEIKVERKLEIMRNNETLNFEKMDTDLNSPLYELGRTAIEIISQEAVYCNFETVGYGLFYPEIKVVKSILSDGVKVYTVKDKKTGKELNMAIRGCVIPAGG